jgi:DNA polymerase III subunit beta
MTSMDTVVATRMRVTCPQEELAQKIGIVGRAVSARTSVQILTGILLRAEAGTLTLAATDMEISLRVSLGGEVEAEGAVVVPGRLLVDIVRLLPGGDVAIEHRPDEGMVHVTSGSASYGLHTYSADDFPRLPEADAARSFAVDRPAFLETVAKVSRSASRDESRPVLTGILVRFESAKLVMAATDSYRLSVKETDLAEAPAQELEAIVPARALGELVRIAQATSAEALTIGVQDNQVVFEADGANLTARRIDGQFPNYKQLVPEHFEAEVELPREEFLDVVRRTSLMAQRKSPLRLRFEEGELTVSAQTQDVGEARESLPIRYAGDVLEIGFNGDFLRDGLESVTDDQVRMKLISPLRPGLIQGEADDFLYLIMPIRLAG